MSEQYWTEQYTRQAALFIHDGNPKRPHALLTSGKHSSGFFDSTHITQNPELLNSACRDLLQKMAEEMHESNEMLAQARWVVGSAMGAVNIAYQAAKLQQCLSAFTEPAEQGGEKKMILKRFNIRRGDRVLVVEDVMTTGGTTLKTLNALIERGADILPVIGVLVNRSDKDVLKDWRIASLIHRPMPMWEPDECPLCKQGSKAIRPKGRNWGKLTAAY
ncbi:hypothetical protein KJ969_00585 [Patescibacteria group bacterium]|nr:hypothetical protein [Patescibacteria group bacterium]MBU1922404.1 hypothetical protein [Patescibacteria group bacterium]